jgi:hypothetical protein
MTVRSPAALDLTGLRTLPSQVWGGIRLVPLVREEPLTDLRLHPRFFGDGAGPALGHVAVAPRTAYIAYIPHAFVATWTRDGSPAAAYGTQLSTAGPAGPPEHTARLHLHRRLARREDRDRLRFLPLHLALEGYLALHFGGPSVMWEEWSRRAAAKGLSPRTEEAYTGAEVAGLADALRVFEIHPGQCGVLLHTGDTLAAAFVVPHPEDYRLLHPTLVQDLFGELVHHHALFAGPLPDFRARIPGPGIGSLADLRAAAQEEERRWARFHDATMAAGLLGPAYTWQRVYRMGRFTLSRFLPAFVPKEENHIGETITDERGRTAYLKTFRLSEAQVRRGHLLDRLAAHDWHLGATATAMGLREGELGMRLEHAGFGALLRQDVLDRYRKENRRRAERS